jgi:hypothetical protein
MEICKSYRCILQISSDFTVEIATPRMGDKFIFLEYSEGYLVPDHFFRLNNWLVKAKGWKYVLTLLCPMRSKGLVLDVFLFNSLVRMFC